MDLADVEPAEPYYIHVDSCDGHNPAIVLTVSKSHTASEAQTLKTCSSAKLSSSVGSLYLLG